MSIDNKNIASWIECLKKEIHFDERMEGTGGLFESLSDKSNSILKKKFLLIMLHELESISAQQACISDLSYNLVFSCVSKETLKNIGFKLFILNKFCADNLNESDWDNIKKAIYDDIRKNLLKRINEFRYEYVLESNRKNLVELGERLEKLKSEYKTYWLSDKKMESKIFNLEGEVKNTSGTIAAIEKDIENNKILLEVVTLEDERLFDVANKKNRVEENGGSNYGLQGAEIYSFDVIKAFCQIMSSVLIKDYNHKGEYSRQYAFMMNCLHEKMLERIDKVVGYRLAENISDGDKDDYPHVSRALMDAFMDSLDSEEGADGKKYFIGCTDWGDGQRIELKLELVDGTLMFKDGLTRGFYDAAANTNIIGLENKKIIDVVKRMFSDNENLVHVILKSLIKEINISFLNPKRVDSSGRILSHKNEIFNVEHELIVYLSSALRNKGFVVSDEYFSSFVFKNRLQNFINARLKQVDQYISDYLDTGLALPFLKSILPGSAPETEEAATKLLDEVLGNPGNDRFSLVISGAVANHSFIRVEEGINKISSKDPCVFNVTKMKWVESYINHTFFGGNISIPNEMAVYIDTKRRQNLNRKFIEKLKDVYKEEINGYKQSLIKQVVDKLTALPDKSIDSVDRWKEIIKKEMRQACYPKKFFGEENLNDLCRDIFSRHVMTFIEKFDMKKVFVNPVYPIDVDEIERSSKKVIDGLVSALRIQEKSHQYSVYYNALKKSYNQVLFEWECREIQRLLKQAIQELDGITEQLTKKGHFELACDFIVVAAEKIVKAAVAVGGVGLLFGMTPQAILCLALLQAVANMNPIILVALFILCYKYILPKLLSDKIMASLKKCEAAILSSIFFAFNMAMLPIIEFIKNAKLLLALKFPKNREKITKMLISFVSALVGVVAFIYCPIIVSTVLVTSAVDIGPLVFAYAASAFTFFVSSLCLGVNYNVAIEEKMGELLFESLKIENIQESELEFLNIFKEMEKDNEFLKEFEIFLLSVKSRPKDRQLNAIINFIEARTFDLLAGLSLSSSDSKLCGVNDIINNLKILSEKIFKNSDDFKQAKSNLGAESNERHDSHEKIEQLKFKIQALAKDAASRRLC